MTMEQPCEKWAERISAWLDGEARMIDRMLVPLHLRECERCRDWVETVRADEQAFREAYMDPAEDEEDLTAAVMARVARQARGKERATKSQQRASSKRLLEILVVVAILAIVTALIFPVFARAREKARQTSCLSNVKQISVALQMYAQDYDGYLPSANEWQELVQPYLNTEQVFHCPARMEGTLPHYALSPFVAGRKLEEIAEPDTTIMIYEVGEGGQPAFLHNDGMNVGYVDGYARWVSEDDAPEQIQSSGFVPPTRNYGIAEHLKVAYEASVQVVVENLYQSVLEAEAAVRGYGGFILNSTLDGRCGHASLTLKVPTAEVGNVVNALGALGFVAHREIAGEDLTRRYVSAGREIEQTHGRSERLETMVQEMGEDEPRVAAEQNLGSVERERTELRDKVWDIDARTTLATVSATLTEEQPEPEPTTIADAFREAVASLAVALKVAGKAGAWVLVFAPIWGGVLAIGWLLLRRAVRGDE